MELSQIINQVLMSLWWLIPIITVIGILKSPIGKGYLGETFVRLLAWMRLDKEIYHIKHNVTLPTLDGTTQIDHILVSRFGIFVLETKNMKGLIFGRESQAQWTQRLYRRSFKFQNPLRQNYKHVKALETALQVPIETIHSVVVFIGSSTFMTEMPSNITQGAGFISYIKSFQVAVFTESQVMDLLQSLSSVRLTATLVTHHQHVQRLRNRSDPATTRLCPKCGNAMVLRTAKNGSQVGRQFWGCSAFPKCRIAQSIS